MSKGNKNTQNHERSEESDRNKPDTLEIGAVSRSKRKRLDSSFYEAKYPGMKFIWEADTGGAVDQWLRDGAQIQKDESDDMISGETHGYKAKNRKGYVSVIAGTDFGAPYEQILLKMPKERYDLLVLKPNRDSNEAIRNSMGRGVASEAERDGSDLQTYAANTPTGGKGFEQIAGQNGFNQLVNK